MTTEWQPMNTAPRDGTRILLWRWNAAVIGRWDFGHNWIDDNSDYAAPEAWAHITPYVPES